jgi:methylase of polypeptide subunit release factors
VSTLDLGTGSGLQALLSAGHSSQVTATDVNRRALRFAGFNAALNDIANVEFRHGSWFEPVRGCTFDLIVANPPYVISPDTTFVYRDSELPGDQVCRRLVREAPAHLTENGTATILCNWVHARDEPWTDPVTDWVRDSGCDALLLHYASDDPIEYARRWNQHLRGADRAQYDQVLHRWCSYYREQGIGAIASGAVVLRRRTGSNWVRTLTAAEGPSGPSGEQILRLLAAHDQQARNDREDALLQERFMLVEGHALEQTLTYRGGEYVNHPAAVRLFSGLGARAEIDPRAVHLLLACDGDGTLGEIVDRFAGQLDLETDQLVQLALHAFRTLLDHGLLEVVGAGRNRPRGMPQTTVRPA